MLAWTAGMEVVRAGLATHYVPSARLAELQTAICGLGPKAGSPQAVADAIVAHQVPVAAAAAAAAAEHVASLQVHWLIFRVGHASAAV